MAWLARLDARARRWPRPAFWGYTALKWYLVALGAWMFIYAWSQNALSPAWLRDAGEAFGHAIESFWRSLGLKP